MHIDCAIAQAGLRFSCSHITKSYFLATRPINTANLIPGCNVFDLRYVSDCRSKGREIDHEMISTAFLLPFADSRKVVVSYKGKYVHKVLVTI